MHQILLRLLCIPMLLAAAACGTPPARIDALAARAGLARATVPGAGFTHVVYTDAASTSIDAPIWVYIESDGTPWIDESIPADDPTPRNPVALPMMLEGPRPAILLGRPCYFGTASTGRCMATWWTHRRFAPEVVDSMAAALERAMADRGWSGRPINLVGFSGGGTLAVLMAPRVERLCAVITVASPLDLAEWTRSRGYSTMQGSIDPALSTPLPERIEQLHLRGALDRVVAADNGARFRHRNPGAEFRVIPGIGHDIGWVSAWAEILRARSGPVLQRCLRTNE